MLCRTAATMVLALLAAGCAQATAADPAAPTPSSGGRSTTSPAPTPTPTSSGDGRLIGRGTVISEGKRTRLCVVVLQSFPPQCGAGIELVGWRWPERGFERHGRTTWGDFGAVGTWDGKRLRVQKVVGPKTRPEPLEDGPDFSTPCPAPSGGWRAPDPARATYETQDRAVQLAERRPDYGDAWIDDLGDHAQIPAKIVLNFRFTEDLAGAEQAIRAVWGGNLCVTRAERTLAELESMQRELAKDWGVLTSGGGIDRLDITVPFDDGTLQRKLDERYEPGLIRVDSLLKPYVE